MNKHNLHKGLGIPQSYFSDLSDDILTNIDILETESELKSAGYDRLGFTIPNEYFSTFDVKPPKAQVGFLSSVATRRIFQSIAVAASLVLGLFLITQLEEEPYSEVTEFDQMLSETEISDEYWEVLDGEFEDIILASNSESLLNNDPAILDSYLLLLDDEDIFDEFSDELIEL